MAEISPKDLENAVYSALKRMNSSGSGGGGGGGSPAAPGPGASEFIKGLGTAATNVKDFGTKIYEGGKEYIGVFRNLSNAGANFSNDIVKIGVAAADSRLSLGEFSDVIKENGKNFAGLGGSVTRGAEAFAKLSKDFFDSRITDELQQLGYSSKELNDVLALTAGAQKSSYVNDKEGRERTTQAAAALAREMDLIAKLTGKSRAEQMEAMSQKKADGQAEAKLRLLTVGKTEEEAAAIRNEYQRGLLEAQKQGTEQAYKEFFATGTYLSEAAATQAALLGDQARAQEESIKAMQSGDFAKAAEARDRSAAESLKNQSDTTILTLATFGSAAGAAGEVAQKNIEVNDALYHSIQNVAKGMQPGLTGSVESFAAALKKAREDVEKSGEGKDVTGKQVSGVTRAGVQGGIQLREGIAGAARSADEAIGKPARDIGLAGERAAATKLPSATEIEDRTKKGLNPQDAGPYASPSEKRAASGGVIGAIASGANKIANMGADVLKVEKIEGLQGRQTGSLGEAGKLIEDFGKGTLTMLHGREGVVTESQMMDLAKGLKSDGIKSAVNQLKSSMPTEKAGQDQIKDIENLFKTMMPTGGAGKNTAKGLDIAGISKQLQTSISSMDTKTVDDLTKTLNTKLDNQDQGTDDRSMKLDTKSIFESFKSNLSESIAPALADLQNPQAVKPATNNESKSADKTENVPSPAQKDATLKDVVGSLDRLNMMMGQMLAQQQDIGMKQIRAAKTAGSLDLYDNL